MGFHHQALFFAKSAPAWDSFVNVFLDQKPAGKFLFGLDICLCRATRKERAPSYASPKQSGEEGLGPQAMPKSRTTLWADGAKHWTGDWLKLLSC